MAARKEIWDLMADGGPVRTEMFSVDADEAVKNDPLRYSFLPPDGTVEAELFERQRAEEAKRAQLAAEEEEKVREAEKADAGKSPSKQGQIQQAENERDQKQARAREDRAAAERDFASDGLTTTTLPGPVPNRAGLQLDDQIPAGQNTSDETVGKSVKAK
jgi:ATPase subunit of ABC transporter with duplicated ATPase domains